MDDVNSGGSFFTTKRKVELFVIIAVVAFIASLSMFLVRQSANKSGPIPSNQSTNQNITPTQALQQTSSFPSNDPPDVDPKELQKQMDETKKTFEKNGQPAPTEKQYQFQYELSPDLYDGRPQSKKSFFGVLAQEPGKVKCNLSLIPTTATIYSLKSQYTPEEAQEIGKKFGVVATAAAIVQSGITQYVLADPAVSPDYVTINAPSGSTLYHHVSTSAKEPIDETKAADVAIKTLTKFGLVDSTIDTTIINNQAKVPSYFAFRFNKNWSLPVVDDTSVKTIGLSSICDIAKAAESNYIEADLKIDGEISNIIDRTRKIVKKATVPLLDLKTAIAANKDNQLGTPTVFADDITTGKATILEATLAYFERGELIGKNCYIPTYIVSGTVSGARIVSMFPAVAKDITDGYCKDANGSSSGKKTTTIENSSEKAGTIKYSTFEFAPPPLPTPKTFDQCYGKIADYFFNCKTSSGAEICSAFLGVPEADDKYDTCFNSCRNPIPDMTMPNTGDVCQTFATKVLEMKGQTLPATYQTNPAPKKASTPTKSKYCTPYLVIPGCPKSGSSTSTQSNPPTGGSVVCSFKTCPC